MVRLESATELKGRSNSRPFGFPQTRYARKTHPNAARTKALISDIYNGRLNSMVGVCICEHHGRAALADVCIYIHEAVDQRSRAHNVVSARFRMGNFGGQQHAEVIFTLFFVPRVLWTIAFSKKLFQGNHKPSVP